MRKPASNFRKVIGGTNIDGIGNKSLGTPNTQATNFENGNNVLSLASLYKPTPTPGIWPSLVNVEEKLQPPTHKNSFQQLQMLQMYFANKNMEALSKRDGDVYILAEAVIEPSGGVGGALSRGSKRSKKHGGAIFKTLKILIKKMKKSTTTNQVVPVIYDTDGTDVTYNRIVPPSQLVNNFVVDDTREIEIVINIEPDIHQRGRSILPWDVITNIYKENELTDIFAKVDLYFSTNEVLNIDNALLALKNALNTTAQLHTFHFDNFYVPDHPLRQPMPYKPLKVDFTNKSYMKKIDMFINEATYLQTNVGYAGEGWYNKIDTTYDTKAHIEKKLLCLDNIVANVANAQEVDTVFNAIVDKICDNNNPLTFEQIFEIVDLYEDDVDFIIKENNDDVWDFNDLSSLLRWISDVGDMFDVNLIRDIDKNKEYRDLDVASLLTDNYDTFVTTLTDVNKTNYVLDHYFQCAVIYAVSFLIVKKTEVRTFLTSKQYMYEKSLRSLFAKYRLINQQLDLIQNMPIIQDFIYKQFPGIVMINNHIRNVFSLDLDPLDPLDIEYLNTALKSANQLKTKMEIPYDEFTIKFIIHAYECLFVKIPEIIDTWFRELIGTTFKGRTIHRAFGAFGNDPDATVSTTDIFYRFLWDYDRRSRCTLSGSIGMFMYVPNDVQIQVRKDFRVINNKIIDEFMNVKGIKDDSFPYFMSLVKYYKVIPPMYLTIINNNKSFTLLTLLTSRSNPKTIKIDKLLAQQKTPMVNIDIIEKTLLQQPPDGRSGGKLKKKVICQYTKSDKRHEVNGRKYIVYVGKRGGEYIKMKGEYKSIKSVKSKKATTPLKK
jgi:hypothetical protein